MNNYLKSIATQRNTIPYRKELNQITGGIIGSILLQQMMYWYEINEEKEFYKFIKPCKHPLYQSGDSWTEELGLSEKQYNTARKQLEKEELVSHRTDHNRVTWYKINEEKLNEKMNEINWKNNKKKDNKVKMIIENKVQIERPAQSKSESKLKISQEKYNRNNKKRIERDQNGNAYDTDGNWISESRIKEYLEGR